jgi:hypothetical protein
MLLESSLLPISVIEGTNPCEEKRACCEMSARGNLRTLHHEEINAAGVP